MSILFGSTVCLALLAAPLANTAITDVKERIEVPFKVAGDAMFVDVTVNSRPVTLLFDTGFSGSFVLDPSVDVGKATGTIMLRDFVGQFEAPTVPVKSVGFGGKNIDVSSMTIVKKDSSGLSAGYGLHCDGMMGFEVIAPYVVEINFEKSRFIFHPRKSVDLSKRTPDGVKTFAARMLPIGANSIELLVEAHNGQKMKLALDTGNAFFATTHRDVLERIGVWEEGKKPNYMRQSMVASGPVDSWDLLMKDTKIYGVPVPESIWNIIDLPASSAEGDGTVGFRFLRNFNITIDVEQRRVWLENFTGSVKSEEKGSIGLYAVHDPSRKRMRIAYVTPGGPADLAGIKRGDDLLGIDGKELTILTFQQILDLLEGEVGTKVKLALSRGGGLLRHELTRQVLVNKKD
jgi:predicted aspartyl protease